MLLGQACSCRRSAFGRYECKWVPGPQGSPRNSRHRPLQRQHVACRGDVLERSSSDPDDELDSSYTLDIKQRADPRYLSKVAKRLEVVWSVSSRKARIISPGLEELVNFSRKLSRGHGSHFKDALVQGRKPGQCACCRGSGKGACSFCRGTGALTLGDHVFCSLQDGCKPCPVCKRTGAVKCEHCSGTGFRAAWMEEPNCQIDWKDPA